MEVSLLLSMKGRKIMSDTTFKEAMQRLENIVSLLERNEIELEEAMSLFEEGLGLIKSCDVQLQTFENKVQTLLEEYQRGNQNES